MLGKRIFRCAQKHCAEQWHGITGGAAEGAFPVNRQHCHRVIRTFRNHCCDKYEQKILLQSGGERRRAIIWSGLVQVNSVLLRLDELLLFFASFFIFIMI